MADFYVSPTLAAVIRLFKNDQTQQQNCTNKAKSADMKYFVHM